MNFVRSANATWQGSIKEGKGAISTESGALQDQPFGFNTRFSDEPGTNPEELIGAAHAGCFSMALSKTLGEAGFEADSIETKADVVLVKGDSGFSITEIKLQLRASIAKIDDETFQELALKTKDACPVSKVLNADITLEATLLNS